MSKSLALYASVSIALLMPAISFAAPIDCGCTNRTEAEQIDRNDVVIEGKVISLKQIRRLRFRYNVARIEIQKATKGTKRKYISVQAIDRQGACAVPFKLDQSIRLAARKRGTSYRTNICKIFASTP